MFPAKCYNLNLLLDKKKKLSLKCVSFNVIGNIKENNSCYLSKLSRSQSNSNNYLQIQKLYNDRPYN